jgi:hypothetical protein
MSPMRFTMFKLTVSFPHIIGEIFVRVYERKRFGGPGDVSLHSP